MASPEWSSVFDLYQRVMHVGLLEYLQKQAGLRRRRGIYTIRVVLWLMMVQQLRPKGTLASAVQELAQGYGQSLAPDCKRLREGRISLSTGGYCQARQKLPKELVHSVNNELVERLREQVSEPLPGLDRPVFLLDGSSVQLEHSPELVRCYPPHTNQHGRSHWPVIRLVVLHDVSSGLAQPPCWGAMCGSQAVSEQALAEQAMQRLPHPAVVIGDRNFGVFSIAYVAQRAGHQVLLRLTDVRAHKLVERISRAGEYAVSWKPSRWDKAKQQPWPPEAAVQGRLMAYRIGRGKKKTWLYLFTDLNLPAEQIVELYARRWNIETDLRALKQTVRLQHLTAKTTDMMEKEFGSSGVSLQPGPSRHGPGCTTR
jgi:putative transposase